MRVLLTEVVRRERAGTGCVGKEAVLSAEPSTNLLRRTSVPRSAQMTRSACHRVIYVIDGRASTRAPPTAHFRWCNVTSQKGPGLWFATLTFECQHSLNPINRSFGTGPLGGRLNPSLPDTPPPTPGVLRFRIPGRQMCEIGGPFWPKIRINSGWRQSVPRASDRLDELRLAGSVDLAP